MRDWLRTTKSEDWKHAGAKLIRVLEDPFTALDSAERREEGDPNTASRPADAWLDAPPALTRSLCDIREDTELQRYAIAGDRARRPARAPPRCRDPAAPAGRRGPESE